MRPELPSPKSTSGWRALASAMEAFSAELRGWTAGTKQAGGARRSHRDALQATLGRSARAFDAVQAKLDEELSRLERDSAKADEEMAQALEVVSELDAGAEGFLPEEAQALQARLLSIQASWLRLVRQDRRSRLERARVARLWRELRDGILPGLAASAKGSPAASELAALKARFEALESLWEGTGGAEAAYRTPLEESLPRLVAKALQRAKPALVVRELRSRLDQSLAEARSLRLKLDVTAAEAAALREEVKELRSHAADLDALRAKDAGAAEALRAAAVREQWLEFQDTIKALREELESLKDARRVDAERAVGRVEHLNRETAEARRRAEAARRAGEVEEERAAELEAKLDAVQRDVARWRGRARSGDSRVRELEAAAESLRAELQALRERSALELAESEKRRIDESAAAEERLAQVQERLKQVEARLVEGDARLADYLAQAEERASREIAEAGASHAQELARLHEEAEREIEQVRALAAKELETLTRDFERGRSEVALLKVERAESAQRIEELDRELASVRGQIGGHARRVEEAAREAEVVTLNAARRVRELGEQAAAELAAAEDGRRADSGRAVAELAAAEERRRAEAERAAEELRAAEERRRAESEQAADAYAALEDRRRRGSEAAAARLAALVGELEASRAEFAALKAGMDESSRRYGELEAFLAAEGERRAQAERRAASAEAVIASGALTDQDRAFAGAVWQGFSTLLVRASEAMAGEAEQAAPAAVDAVAELRDAARSFLLLTKPIEPRPVPLRQVLGEALARWEPVLRRRRVAVERRWDAELSAVVPERAALEAALHLLLRNAHDALPHGGRVTVQALVPPDGGIEITVSDTGRGFTKAALERYRTGKPSGRRGRLGLGLALAGRLVARLGGRLEPENATVGARVVIRLPD